MTTASPENAKSWRDLIDQLTPDQIAELEESERHYRSMALPPPYPWWATGPPSELLLHRARRYARDNWAVTGGIPRPAGAVIVGEWCDVDSPNGGRSFVIASRKFPIGTAYGSICDIEVESSGWQFVGGRVQYEVQVYIPDEPLSSESARQLAAALIGAADEIDRLASQ